MNEIEQKERQSFTFYLSFYKAAKGLKNRERLAIYDAIVEYSLLGKEPDDLSSISQLVWDLVEPILSKSRVGFLNGVKGGKYGELGGAPKGNDNARKESLPHSENNPQNNPRDKETDRDKDRDKDRETDRDTNKESVPSVQTKEPREQQRPRRRRDGSPSKSARELMDEYLVKIRSDAMRTAIGEWFEYKQERGEAYRTLRSMQLFCLRLRELADGNEYRAQKILQNSMANNWSGIFPLNDDYVPLAQRGEGYLRGYS